MIKIKDMHKSFNNKVVFKDFNLQINSGEFLGIVGKSGKGKTTLLNIIGTLEDIDSGIIEIMGKQIKKKKDKRNLLRNHLGFVFQNYALIDNLSVKENLEIALNHKKIKKEEKRNLIESALKKVGLENYEKNIICTLSGGEQQRIAIARLILKDPDIILADEPTGSLDIENRNIIVSLLEDMHKRGKTIIMVTHDKSLINSFSRVIEI